MNDLKFAIRQLFKSPGFTAAAVLTLALAIGVNTAIFALVDRAILRPVVKQDPASVVAVFTGRKGTDSGWRQFSYAEYSALRESKEVFSDVCAVNFTLAGLGKDLESQKRGFAFIVSENYLSLHGAAPERGRNFTAEECKPGADIPVAIVSHDYAHRIGNGGEVIGKTLRVNGDAFTIVGVAP